MQHAEIARELRDDIFAKTVEAEHRLMRAFALYYPTLRFRPSEYCVALPAGKTLTFESARYDRANGLFVVGFEVEGQTTRAWIPIELFDELVERGSVAILG